MRGETTQIHQIATFTSPMKRKLPFLDYLALFFRSTFMYGLVLVIASSGFLIKIMYQHWHGLHYAFTDLFSLIILPIGLLIGIPGFFRCRRKLKAFRYGKMTVGVFKSSTSRRISFGEHAKTANVVYTFEVEGKSYECSTLSDASMEARQKAIVLYIENDPTQNASMWGYPKTLWEGLYLESMREDLGLVNIESGKPNKSREA
jgi:hypothetical protein